MTLQNASPVAPKLRGLAAEKGIKYYQLSEQIGVSRQQLYQRLSGKVPFNDRELVILAAYLDVPVSALFGEAA